MKRANVCVYTTLMIRINGIEGETDEAIIEEAQSTIARENLESRINQVLVNPLSPTARNLMGEVVLWQLDADGANTYMLAENEHQDDEVLRHYEDHPLKMEPRPFSEDGDRPSESAFKLIAQTAELDPNDSSGQLADIITQAKALSV